MDNFDNWFKMNKNALEHLYNKLLIISERHGYKLYRDQNTMNDFIIMMYEELFEELKSKNLTILKPF